MQTAEVSNTRHSLIISACEEDGDLETILVLCNDLPVLFDIGHLWKIKLLEC